MKNTKLHVNKFFKNRFDYIILKMSDMFPSYTPGSDIDILCRDMNAFAEWVLTYEPDAYVHKAGTHLQVDVKKDGKLELKFDLIDSLAEYGLNASHVFSRSHFINRDGDNYCVPWSGHEALIRLVEYEKDPRKWWHKEYIKRWKG